ncbi:MAG: hypothetical protein ACT4OV_00920 [Microthrixaceae bacterium]
MRRSPGLAIAVAGCITIAACSGGNDDGSATTTSFESYVPPAGPSLGEWQAQTIAVCEEYEPQQDAIVAAHGDVSSLDDIVALIDELEPVVSAYITELNGIPVPAARRSDVERTYELNSLNGAAAQQLRAAAAAGDESGARAASGALNSQSAQLKALLLDLEVDACADAD